MTPLTSRKSWLLAPLLALFGLLILLFLWVVIDPCVYVEWFDTEKALFSPVEWMTLPLFGLIIPLVKGFFRFAPVAWSAATFGAVSTFVLMIDRLPANLRDWGIVNLKAPGHEAGLALCKSLEEGSEMIMAFLALLTLLQSYLIFGRNGDAKASD